MANITASMVKELREKTSAGMLDCKKALAETDGDMEKAIEYLRENYVNADPYLMFLSSAENSFATDFPFTDSSV